MKNKEKYLKNPNPQGKGLVPVLDCLAQSRALTTAKAKNIQQISSELFTSMFILHSQFQFKPVVGKCYWLYQRGKQFQLSLVSPSEWGEQGYGLFIGECVLQQDITWSLTLDDSAANNLTLMQYIQQKKDEFEQLLGSAGEVDHVLPFYLEKLPFYQRVYASALANSLQQSMIKSGITGLSYTDAQKYLSHGG